MADYIPSAAELALLSVAVGVKSPSQDYEFFLRSKLTASVAAMEDAGVVYDPTNPLHVDLLIGYASWKAKSSSEAMPRGVQYALNTAKVNCVKRGGST